jgi:hypothetical protein
MPAKELKKGGKPAQVKGTCDVVMDENKAFLKALFSGEPAEALLGLVVKTLGVEHEKRQASAGITAYGGTRMTNLSMTFGTDTDYILETADGGEVVVPKRFLNHRGEVHQSMFKVGDVIITTTNGCEKTVNIGLRNGAMMTKGRGWHEVKAWIPADKVARAVKEGRLRSLEEKPEGLVNEDKRLAAEAAQKANADAIYAAEVAALKAMDAAAGGGGGGGGAEEDLGSWY